MKNFFNQRIDTTTTTITLIIVFGLLTLTTLPSLVFSSSTNITAEASSKNGTRNNANAMVVVTDIYKGYMDGKLFMLITDSTREEAAGNCLLNATVNPEKSVLCTWGNEEIYNLSATDKRDKCNKDVDIKKNQKKGIGVLPGSILLGTCDVLLPVTTDVELVDSLVSQIKLGSEANPTYGWTVPMLLQSYTGLLLSDFASVETIFVPPGTVAAITSGEFRTLARNLSARFGIPLDSSTAIDSIITNIQVAP